MKKSFVLILVVSLLLSFANFTASALTFTDLAASHWAYNDVQTLVNDGTVSGYGDGTFRPNGTVTRAEFVKMIGAAPVSRVDRYFDVDETHWAYTFIMTSGMKEDGSNRFFPDRAITRGEVV